MSRVDELQERHDILIKEIEMHLRANLMPSVAEDMIHLVNRYGDTCIRLVEAEHAECGS